MAFTVRELITKAFYLSSIASRSFQEVPGGQLSDGLDLLNELLAGEALTGELVPYYTEYSLNLVAGQEKYFIPNLIDMETFTFNIGDVRYSTGRIERRHYQGSARVDNIESLPRVWNLEREKGGATLSVYFKPNENYAAKIWGKFGLTELEKTNYDDDLLLTYDRFYLTYLRYALAEYICEDHDTVLSEQGQEKLNEIKAKLSNLSPMDLSIKKLSSFRRGTLYNWGQINLGKGWSPSP